MVWQTNGRREVSHCFDSHSQVPFCRGGLKGVWNIVPMKDTVPCSYCSEIKMARDRRGITTQNELLQDLRERVEHLENQMSVLKEKLEIE